MAYDNNEATLGVWQAVTTQGRWIAAVLGIAFVMGVIVLLVHFTTHVNVREIMSDPAETALLPEYAGLYSYIGVLLLWTGAVVGFIASKYGAFRTLDERRFVGSFAVIAGLVAIDDLFMVHEWVGLKLAQWTNANDIEQARSALEAVVFAVYILAGLSWVWIKRHNILRSPWSLFALGVIGFAGSITLDLAPYVFDQMKNVNLRVETTMAVAEDMAKLVGIGGFTAYSLALSLPRLRANAMTESRDGIDLQSRDI